MNALISSRSGRQTPVLIFKFETLCRARAGSLWRAGLLFSLADGDTHTAVGHHHRTDDKAGAIGGQKRDDLSDLDGVSRPADRRILAVFGKEFSPILPEMIEQVGDDVANTDGIDANTVLDRFERLGSCHLSDGALRRGIGGDAREGEVRA